jgi:hypothetical protein
MTRFLRAKIYLLYEFAPFMAVSTTCGESRPVYGDVYTVGEHGEGYFYSTWVAA